MLTALILAAIAVEPAAIEWSSPEGCPDANAVVDRVIALGADPATPDTDVRGSIRSEGDRFVLFLAISTPTGTTHKHVADDACEALGDAAALMISVALDPVAVASSVQPREDAIPPTSPELPPAPVAPAQPPPRSEAPARTRAPLQGLVRAAGSLGYGIVPGPEGRVSLGLGLRGDLLRAELIGFHAFCNTATYASHPGVGARICAYGASARVGAHARLRRLELGAMAGISVAAVTGSGFGTTRDKDGSEAWIAAVLVPGMRWPLGRVFAIGADIELEVGIQRPGFALAGLGAVHRAALIGVAAAFVAEVRFGGRDDQTARTRRPRAR